MTTVTIEIPEERLTLLQQRAATLGITPEDLLRLSIEDLLARPTPEIQRAIAYIITKNADLYRRLA